MPDRPATTTLSLQPGEKIGSFVVTGVVATGGTGTVYRAHDPLLDRYVAIKHVVFGDAIDADRLREQVRREAALHKKVAAGKPKRLVQFIDTIEDPRGLMLVTEFVDGVTLEQRLAANPAPHDERAALGIVAASAKSLQHLHAAGVVHRDIKPGNIMLPHKGGLKLADFGLAAIVGDQESLSLGTVRYMAPELLRGDPATPAGDLYSLGLVAYELLLGREKFDQAFKTVLRDKRNPGMRWMKWHTNDRLTAPPLAELMPGTPETLSELIARMMDKDPARRIRSATEVVDAIRRHFVENQNAPLPTDDEDDGAAPALLAEAHAESPDASNDSDAPGSAPAFSTPGDTAKLPTKSKLPVLLSALVAFWVVVGAVIWVVQSRQDAAAEQQRLDEATEQFTTAKRQLLDGNYTAALVGFETLRNEFGENPRFDEIGVVWAGFTQGRIAEQEGDYAAALEAYRDFDASPMGERELVRPLIDAVQRKSGFETALDEIEQLVEDGEFQQGRQRIGQWRGEQLTEQERQRLDDADAALAAAEAEQRVAVLLRQAQTFADAGDLDAAIGVLEQRNVLPPSGVNLLARFRAQRDLNAALSDARDATGTGRLEDAIAAYRRALELRPDPLVTAELNRLEATLAVRLGARFLDEGRLEDAAAQFDIALQKDPTNAEAQRNRKQLVSVTEVESHLRAGDAAMDTGDFEAAIAQYTKAYGLEELPIVREKLDEARRRLAVRRATAAIEAGALTAAREQLDLARTIAPDHAELGDLEDRYTRRQEYQAKLDAADARRAEGKFNLAIRRYQEAKELLDSDEVNRRIQETQYAFSVSKARAYMAQDLFEPAKAELEYAARIDFTDEVKQLLRDVHRELGLEPFDAADTEMIAQ